MLELPWPLTATNPVPSAFWPLRLAAHLLKATALQFCWLGGLCAAPTNPAIGVLQHWNPWMCFTQAYLQTYSCRAKWTQLCPRFFDNLVNTCRHGLIALACQDHSTSSCKPICAFGPPQSSSSLLSPMADDNTIWCQELKFLLLHVKALPTDSNISPCVKMFSALCSSCCWYFLYGWQFLAKMLRKREKSICGPFCHGEKKLKKMYKVDEITNWWNIYNWSEPFCTSSATTRAVVHGTTIPECNSK